MSQQPAGRWTGWQPDQQSPPLSQSFEAGSHPYGHPWAGTAEIAVVARRNGFGLTVWVLLCLALAGVYLYRTPPEFVATTQVVLEARRQLGAGDAASTGPLATLDSAQADSEIQVVKSERNLRYVFNALGLVDEPAFAPEPPGLIQQWIATLLPSGRPAVAPAGQTEHRRTLAFQNFSDRVGVRRVGQSYVLEVSFRAPDPAQAARLANSVTAAYILDQIAFKAAAVQRGTEFLQGRIASIKSEQQVAADAVEHGTIPDMQFADADARVVSAALEPLGKSYPQSKLILLVVGLFALLSGIAVVAVRHSLDRIVRSRHQVAQALGLDCLSVLPRIRLRGGGRIQPLSCTAVLDRPDSDFARAVRVLRASLFAARAQPRNAVLGVVSCSPREGRSMVAANLAYLLAASGKTTLLIDADIRQPTLTQVLAPGASSGLDDMLASHAAQPHLPEIRIGPDLGFVPAVGTLSPADPNVALGSAQMQQALMRARGAGNIIIDLPPLEVSADAQAIGHLLDGVILLVEVNRTSLEDVSEAIRALRTAEVRLLGIVLNKMPGRPRRSLPAAPARSGV